MPTRDAPRGTTPPDLVARIDDLRRAYPAPLVPGPVTRPDVAYLWRVRGIGVATEQTPFSIGGHRTAGDAILVGLASTSTPFAMVLDGVGGRVRIDVGVWQPAGWPSPEELGGQHRVLAGLLEGVYSQIHYEQVVDDPADAGRFTEAGVAFGVPTRHPVDSRDGANQLDRLVRTMRGADWRAMLLAQPVDEHYVTDLRNQLIGEMRTIGTTAASMMRTSVSTPLEQHYADYQTQWLDTLRDGLDRGMWRVAVYLLGDAESYPRLAAAWRATYSGEESLPEPVRVVRDQLALSLATGWAMPDAMTPGGSSTRFVPPFQHQTMLSSSQVAVLVDLPNLETTGFAVDLTAAFDSVTPTSSPGDEVVSVGRVVERGSVIPDEYAIPLSSLTRHVFVAGITGTGKTNTLFHLLKQADRLGASFLVLEPAKREYRSLLADPDLRRPPRVLTLGDERLAPLRLNPFEPEPGAPLNVHVDLLRSLFGVSLGMWTPLPQVLEKALHKIYADRGWDIATGRNHRLGGEPDGREHDGAGPDRRSVTAAAYPTLTDLVMAVEDLVPTLGYGREVEGNVLGALRTRLGSLRTGGKGRMLDTAVSLPMAALLGRSTVLELEPLGDDDDKAFVMGLLLLRLAEHRRVHGPRPGLQHLLVIEEAHRLLRNVGGPDREESADPRGKAVETFSNLLAEVRAYGQGVVVTDQVPTKLAPDVIKNTTLKIVHRIVANDDRMAMGGAMAMNELQMRSLASLPLGRAAVFGRDDDAAILVQVPLAKGDGRADDAAVAQQRAAAYAGAEELLAGCRSCRDAGAGRPGEAAAPARGAGGTPRDAVGSDDVVRLDRSCELARRLADGADLREVAARLAVSMAELPGSRERLWPDVEAAVMARRPPDVDADLLCRAAFAHAAERVVGRWGAARGWSYELTEALRSALVVAVVATDDAAAGRYRALSARAHEVDAFPLLGCAAVCGGDGPLRCAYRHAVVPATRARDNVAAFEAALELDIGQPGDEPLTRTWEEATRIASEIVEFPSFAMDEDETDAAQQVAFRVGLCAAQHLLTDDHREPWSVRRRRVDVMMEVHA